MPAGLMLTRREFTHALSLLGLSGCAAQRGLLRTDEAVPLLPDPTKTGRLTASDKERLWQIFQRIETTWETKSDLSRSDFESIIDLKTDRPPTYLTVYRQAVMQDQSTLFSAEAPAVIRQFVLAEFIELYLIYGGFRMFSLRNYKGFVGGSFHAPETPYRTGRPT